MNRFLLKTLPVLLAFGLVFQACKKDPETQLPSTHEIGGAVATAWMTQLRELTKTTPGFTPPVAARAFGYAGLALYETVVPGMPYNQSMVGQLSDLTALPKTDPSLEYHFGVAANSAMAEVARNFYANTTPANLTAVQNLENQWVTTFEKETTTEIFERSVAWGKEMAAAIFEYSKFDGGHEGYSKNFPTDFVPRTGPGLWVPTAPAFSRALQPYWGKNRTFIPGAATLSQPPAPLEFSTDVHSAFYAQALETYSAVANATVASKKTAEYWSDDPGIPGTPPGHFLAITVQILEKNKLPLDRCAEVLALSTMAVSDAFVSCWKCKYDFSLVRPITYIRENIDPNWSPILTTPPFPEYTSGHSSASGAWSQVMSDLFGYNYLFIDRTHEARTDIDGSARSYSSFFEAAEEAAVSRLYGGIHYRNANETGVKMGRVIGKSAAFLRLKSN